MIKRSLILLELNEINFDIVKLYIEKFPKIFPGFEKLYKLKNIQTSSEGVYSELEPWIQWASVHTGKTFSEHKIFRLGDIVGSGVPQIFEQLEQCGIAVGCICPMNAENRLKNPTYFIPDPWTRTLSDKSWWSRKLSASLSQAINENSQSKITLKSASIILLGLIRFAKFRHYFLYLKLIVQSVGFSWRRALVLDLFLHDLHHSLFESRAPQFSTLFLNAGAHLQHHYIHNSPFVFGKNAINIPDWYISSELDPIHEMLKVYDIIIEEYLDDSKSELIIATGLSQRPYDRVKYYYRLKNHFDFFVKIGIHFLEIQPRMTRDFLVKFSSIEDAVNAQNILRKLVVSNKQAPLFGEIENRGKELFIVLTYPDRIIESDLVSIGDVSLNLLQEVTFVAIKNGMHQAKGFAFFTDEIAMHTPKNGSHVKEIHGTISNYFINQE